MHILNLLLNVNCKQYSFKELLYFFRNVTYQLKNAARNCFSTYLSILKYMRQRPYKIWLYLDILIFENHCHNLMRPQRVWGGKWYTCCIYVLIHVVYVLYTCIYMYIYIHIQVIYMLIEKFAPENSIVWQIQQQWLLHKDFCWWLTNCFSRTPLVILSNSIT